jgi:hypothetical protein
LYTQQEEWPKAIASFEDASAIDPENQVCRYELGVVFARVHRYDQALSHLTYAVGESAANYNIGYVLHEQGNDTDAAEWFQNALQAHPDKRTTNMINTMLAEISTQNTRSRSNPPAYPSANPSDEFVARRTKQSAMDQFEPASFEQPQIRGAGTNESRQNDRQLPSVSSVANSQEYSEPSTLLPPVNEQAAVQGNASPAAVSLVAASDCVTGRSVQNSVACHITGTRRSATSVRQQASTVAWSCSYVSASGSAASNRLKARTVA